MHHLENCMDEEKCMDTTLSNIWKYSVTVSKITRVIRLQGIVQINSLLYYM